MRLHPRSATDCLSWSGASPGRAPCFCSSLEAWSANEHVPAILAGTKPAANSNEGYITMGGPDEATYYVSECGAAWHRTPGAVAWLTKLATTLAPKRRDPCERCTDPG